MDPLSPSSSPPTSIQPPQTPEADFCPGYANPSNGNAFASPSNGQRGDSRVSSPPSAIRKGRQGMWSSQSSVAISDQSPPEAGAKRDFALRPRTRTVGERYVEESRTPFTTPTRERMASISSNTAQSAYSDTGFSPAESLRGVGFPSFLDPFQSVPIPPEPPAEREKILRFPSSSPGPPSPPQRQRLVKSPPPRRDNLSRSASSAKVSASANVKAPELGAVFSLVKKNRGRMRGKLHYKANDYEGWAVGFCFVDEVLVSLVLENDGTGEPRKILLSDLRSYQLTNKYDTTFGETCMELVHPPTRASLSLRPVVSADYNNWAAAFIYWQLSPSESAQQTPQQFFPLDGRPFEYRRRSEMSLLKDASIIKVGKMMAWDPGIVTSVTRLHQHKVSCILRENGELKLYTESDIDLVSTIQLSQLYRSSIQRLDPSVAGEHFCVAVLPHNCISSTAMIPKRPIYLSLDSRVLFETWFVMLRAFARPELYFPEQISDRTSFRNSMRKSNLWDTSMMDLFRIERALSVRVIEAKFNYPRPTTAPENSVYRHHQTKRDFFAEVLLDGEVRAKTLPQQHAYNPFWREDFKFSEISGALPRISIILKKLVARGDDEISGTSVHSKVSDHHASGRSSESLHVPETREVYAGRVDIRFENVGHGRETEAWWPILGRNGEHFGEILLRIRGEELPLLISHDYDDLSEVLHRFSNGVTIQVAQMIPSKLHRLSEILLNIFQASGTTVDWLRTLVEEEFDGTYNESTIAKMNTRRKAGQGEPLEPGSDRDIIRELGRAAPVEANLLFRGNNLLTKSLDLHLQRVGKEYLEETLHYVIASINENEVECEVDPSRVLHAHDLKRNWRNLTRLFERVWNSIHDSAGRCPMELRIILRHVQACAEDRFETLRSVKYSSVSGFLFLRFFCPAVLNPRLFNLLKDNPRPRAQRALTLIAKSLQGLANMSAFGVKEAWMEPMNNCLTRHRQGFKDFIDAICTIPLEYSLSIPPSYATPNTILSRMTPAAREGCPSLPYLIDQAQNFAALISLWIEFSPSVTARQTMDGDLLKFHLTCIDLHQRTQDLLSKTTQTQKTWLNSPDWGDMFERLSQSSVFGTSDTPHQSKSPKQASASPRPLTFNRSLTPTETTTSSSWTSARLLKFKVRSDDELSSHVHTSSGGGVVGRDFSTPNLDAGNHNPLPAATSSSPRPRINDFLPSFFKKGK